MEDLGSEPAFWRLIWEVRAELKSDLIVAALKGCSLRTFDPPDDVEHVILIEDDADPFWRAVLQLDELLAEPPEGAARH